MNPRNFSRVFRKETGITPAKFAERLRVEAAPRQLEQTAKAVKEIATSYGFSTSEIMRRTFLSQLQVTPSAYRLRFSAAVVHPGQAARSALGAQYAGAAASKIN
jgi:transcriptional regulator GlxA family with amidase domain